MRDATVPSPGSAAFGSQLKRWRSARSVSQLGLAVGADVSQRHISFLETGRSRPSREMVLHLCGVLDLPLRARNELLRSAGFAAAYPERQLDDPALSQIRRVVGLMLDAHDPFPAYVVDRCWNVVMANPAAARLTGLLPDSDAARAASGGNIVKLLLHPDGFRPHVANWDRAGLVLLERLRREVADRPGDADVEALFAEACALAAIDDAAAAPREAAADDLVVPLHLTLRGLDFRLFTTIATIGAPYDVTLEELRLETLLPADTATEQTLRRLADGHLSPGLR